MLFTLKPGLDEKLHERALVIELTKQGLRCESQRQFEVHYEGQHSGTLVPDLIVDGLVIVEPKVVTAFNDTPLAPTGAAALSPEGGAPSPPLGD